MEKKYRERLEEIVDELASFIIYGSCDDPENNKLPNKIRIDKVYQEALLRLEERISSVKIFKSLNN